MGIDCALVSMQVSQTPVQKDCRRDRNAPVCLHVFPQGRFIVESDFPKRAAGCQIRLRRLTSKLRVFRRLACVFSRCVLPSTLSSMPPGFARFISQVANDLQIRPALVGKVAQPTGVADQLGPAGRGPPFARFRRTQARARLHDPKQLVAWNVEGEGRLQKFARPIRATTSSTSSMRPGPARPWSRWCRCRCGGSRWTGPRSA